MNKPTTTTVELDGTTYVLSQATIADLKDIESYAQRQILENVKGQLEGLPLELQKHLLSAALEEQLRCRIGSREFDRVIQTPSAMPYLFWVAVRKRHPEVSLDKAKEIVTFDNLAKIGDAIGRVLVGDNNPLPQGSKA